jgi:hypothetical protein
VDTVIKGFHRVVGVGICYKADAVSNQLGWPYESDVCGVIRDNNGRDVYLVKEPSQMVHAIHSSKCMGTGDGGNTCSGCISVTSSFYRRCRSAVHRCS